MLAFREKWNPLEIILNQDIIDEQLTDIWLRAKLFSKGDDMSYLRKPPEELDQKQTFEGHGKRNPKIALPILVNVGTHSTVDAQKIIDHVQKQCGVGQKALNGGDMQTLRAFGL
jgi:hypothetical protein